MNQTAQRLKNFEADTYEIGGLDNILPKTHKKGVWDNVKPDPKKPVTSSRNKYLWLHNAIMQLKPLTVIEFGVGYSTLIMAHALAKLHYKWSNIATPEVRNHHMFEIHCVDASKKWINYWREHIPEELKSYIHLHYSPCVTGSYQDQIVHYYTDMPNLVADCFHIDAPGNAQIRGGVHGVTFDPVERTPVGADIVQLEPTLLPGTSIIVNGYTNMSRFLQRKLTRDFTYFEHIYEDYSLLRLDEEPLSPNNHREYASDLSSFDLGLTWAVNGY